MYLSRSISYILNGSEWFIYSKLGLLTSFFLLLLNFPTDVLAAVSLAISASAVFLVACVRLQ